MKAIHSPVFGSLFFIAVLSVSLSAHAFDRGERVARGDRDGGTTTRSGTFQTQRGGSGTFNQTATHAPGSTTSGTAWTNARGGTDNHSTATTSNKATGTGTQNSSTTYANGKSSSSQGELSKTGTGTANYTGTHTGVNGQTTDVSKSVSDASGVKTINSTYTNPTTGKSSTVDKSISGGQVTTTATGPNGKTATSDQTYTKSGTSYTQTGTVTGPNGNTGTDSHGVNYTKDANGQITRTGTSTVTGPNGKSTGFGTTETYTKTVTPNTTPATSSQPPVD